MNVIFIKENKNNNKNSSDILRLYWKQQQVKYVSVHIFVKPTKNKFRKKILGKKFWKKNFRKKFWKKNFRKKILKKFWKKNF